MLPTVSEIKPRHLRRRRRRDQASMSTAVDSGVAVVDTRDAYSGASRTNSNVALWQPRLRSADADTLRDAPKLRARARDLERNHPYARQAVRASSLGVVGRRLRYSCRPDHRFLGIDIEESIRWGQEFERVWETYAHGVGMYAHAGRRMSFSQVMRMAHKRRFVDGEALVAFEWAKARKWKTCVHPIDCDRLSNPLNHPDSIYLRAGVELNDLGEPVAYHVRNGHPSDVTLGAIGHHGLWDRVGRETPWGRRIIAHSYETDRPDQTRGVSMLAPVIADMKMGQEYTETALQAAILQASYAAVLTSQQNYKEALELIAGADPTNAPTLADLALENLEAAVNYHAQAQIRFNGAQVPILWPGEDFKLLTPGAGAASIGDFQSNQTRSYAAGTGTDPISVSQNYSNVNYSSAKMSMATNWRWYEVLREDLITDIAMPHVAAFLEEVIFSGAMELPKGISPFDFYDAQEALIKGTFLTLGAPNLDPLKEAQATKAEMENGTMTLQDACAEKGLDYLEQLDQIHRENLDRASRGLPPLNPMMGVPGLDASTPVDPVQDL